jgi:hypothetical protein
MTPVEEIEIASAKGGERDVVSFRSGRGMGGAAHSDEVERLIWCRKALT